MEWRIEPFAIVFSLQQAHGIDGYPLHIAFAGKSNVGKSSLLNAVFKQKNMARVSGQPGKTRGLHFYRLNDTALLCDLPGYGYARMSKEWRNRFIRLSGAYFKRYAARLMVFVLVDIRRKPDHMDFSLLSLIRDCGICCRVVLTKADKLSHMRAAAAGQDMQRLLAEKHNIPAPLLTSARKRDGLAQLRELMSRAVAAGTPLPPTA